MGLINNKCTKLIFSFLVIGFAGYLIFNAFQNGTQSLAKNVNEYRTDRKPIVDRFPKLGDFDKCYWKAEAIGRNDFGPSSFWIKGFVFLSDEQRNVFRSQYKWSNTEVGWKPSLGTEILGVQPPLKWSYSVQFNDYIRPANYVGNFYLELNKGIIYFDVEK